MYVKLIWVAHRFIRHRSDPTQIQSNPIQSNPNLSMKTLPIPFVCFLSHLFVVH